MSRHSWGLAVLGVASLLFVPSWGYTQSYNKDAVKALSGRIDGHLAKVWKTAKVTPAVRADDYVFFRRLNLDLNGRIPDLLNLADFRDDPDADKRWMWVDKFLEDKEHSRHFANVWRNIMLGYQTNQQVQFAMPQFETWLREKVEKNVPLNKTVESLLLSQQGNPNMGFNPNGMNVGSPQVFFIANENKAENLAAATSRVFLGVKIECAQCHAHPFAKWQKEQFWEFAAFFSQQQQFGGPIRKGPQPVAPNFQPGREIQIPGTDKVVKAKFLSGEQPNWDASMSSRKTLTDWVTSDKNPYFARAMADHIWAYLMGVSLLEPIMEPSDDSLTHPELLDDLAKGLIDNGFDAKFLIRAIVHSDAYQRSSGGGKLAEKEDYELFVRMPIRALSPEQLYDSFVHATTHPSNDPLSRRMKLMAMPNQQQFFNPGQQQTFRQQFLLKFTNQDRRHEPQTSILQALFLMNGKFMAEQTKLDGPNNEDLALLAASKDDPRTVKDLYNMVLSRPPTAQESARLVRYLQQAGTRGQAVTDIFWALLNSSEFLHNH